jgi:type IV secretory pathway VirB2 component (pilin)
MKKILLSILAIFIGSFVAATSPILSAEANAASNCVFTTVLGNTKCVERNGTIEEDRNDPNAKTCSCDDGQGSDTIRMLELAVDILSGAVGALAVVGIVVVGIQYQTAGDNEERARKAKRRLIEIVIGIAIYICLYALVKWLMPGH